MVVECTIKNGVDNLVDIRQSCAMKEEMSPSDHDEPTRFSEIQSEKLEDVLRSQPLNPIEPLEFHPLKVPLVVQSLLP